MNCELMPYERTFVISLITILPVFCLMKLVGIFPIDGNWAAPPLYGLIVCLPILYVAMCWDACKN